MIVIKNIFLVGTSHIASQSIKEVKTGIVSVKPDFVALELDSGRAYGLKNRTKRPGNIQLIKSLGLGGFLFFYIGSLIQQRFGKLVNIDPGAEMITAMNVAEKEKLEIVFIDREINITLSRFSKYFKKRELFRMILDIIKGIFHREPLSFDMSKVPPQEIIDKILEETKTRYPSIYKILIRERDYYMARRLFELSMLFPDKKIFAVTGAGHVNGILKYLNAFYSNSPLKGINNN